MEIKVEKPSGDLLAAKNVLSWPIWTKDVSRFDWTYDCVEECYFLEGRVTVETKDGRRVSFGKGDFVTFPKGLSCTWVVEKAVRKHYNFR